MLSVILPVRDWPEERIAACARSVLRLKSATLDELLIVDFGSERPVERPFFDDRLRVLRAEAGVWSLGEAINIGVLHTQGAVLAKTDADIVVAAEAGAALDRAVKAAARDAIGLALVQATDLPESVGAEAALDAPSRELDRLGRLRPRWGQGGLAIFSRATWDAIGGFESRFTGWGNEDNDFAERVRHSGRKVRWLDRDAVKIYHVWHPPSFHGKGVAARRIANREIASKDRSVLRPLRILHSEQPREYRGKGLQHPNVVKRSAPLITVAIATAERTNRTRMLKEAIASYIGQADNDMEIIVADNGSTAEEHTRLRAELEKLRLPVRLRTIHVETASIPKARNIITDAAAGRYICVADDDDMALPNRMADHLACFEKDSKLHGSHGGWIDFDETTGVIESNEGKERTLETLLFGTGKISVHGGTCYRTDVLRWVGYDESLALGSDFDLALRMAKVGISVAHTHSIVLLRRFHAMNVTVTGLANQVSNGVSARRRLMDSLGPTLCRDLGKSAKATDKPVYCGNRMDRQRIIEILPSYAGIWRLHFALSELSKLTEGATAAVFPSDDAEAVSHFEDAEAVSASDESSDARATAEVAPVFEQPDLETIERVLAVVDGDIAALASGINVGFAFVSRPIRGASKAIRVKRRLSALGVEAEITADQTLTERQQQGFNWTKLGTPSGTRRLLSAPVSDPIALMQNLAALPKASVLHGMLSFIADGGPQGFRYHLVTGPLRGRESAAAVTRALREHMPLAFSTVASGGVPCDF